MILEKQKMTVEQTRTLMSGLGRLSYLSSPQAVFSYSDVMSCGLLSFIDSPVLLNICSDVTSRDTTFSFLSPLMREFLLGVWFYIDRSENEAKEILQERSAPYYTFLAGLSDPGQRKDMEDSVSGFDESRISEFCQWLTDTASTTLCGYYEEEHFRILRLLQHTRRSALVKEALGKTQWRHIGYGGMQEEDGSALAYVVNCLGRLEYLNFCGAELTEEKVSRLAPALWLSENIK